MPEYKLALLDCHDANFDEIGAISDPNRVAYCERHGIDFIRYRFGPLEPPGRQPNWGKIQGLLKHLPDYDWIFYLDTDSIITNMTINIRSMIDEKYDLIAGIIPEVEGGHLSTGALFVKNCPWSFAFLQDLWNQVEFIEKPWFGNLSGTGGLFLEQSAFHYLYDTRPDYREHISVVSRVKFNSQITFHEPDHFLVHFPGLSHKAELMKLCVEGKFEEAKTEGIKQKQEQERVAGIYRRALKVPSRTKLTAKPRFTSVTPEG